MKVEIEAQVLLERRLLAVSLLIVIALTIAMVPGAHAKSLKWETQYTLDCSNPGLTNVGTSATGIMNLYDVNTLIATVTASCTDSNVVSDVIDTDKVMPTSYELWVYIYADSTRESTCYSGLQNYYPNILYCSNSIYGGAALTLYAPAYKSLNWETPYKLDCSNPGFTNGGTSATGIVNLYSVNTEIATVTVSCTGSNVAIDAIDTKKVMPTSYELWVYIYAGSPVPVSTCYWTGNSYPGILYCSNSIYGGATLTISAPYQP